MKEKFTSAMVVCAAIATFTGGAASIVNGMSSIMDYKVSSVLVAKQNEALAAKLAAEDSIGVSDAIVTGVKKAVKSLN